MFGASALAVRARHGGLSYPAAGHRWAEGHASSPEGAVFLTLLAITAVVAPVIWLVQGAISIRRRLTEHAAHVDVALPAGVSLVVGRRAGLMAPGRQAEVRSDRPLGPVGLRPAGSDLVVTIIDPAIGTAEISRLRLVPG